MTIILNNDKFFNINMNVIYSEANHLSYNNNPRFRHKKYLLLGGSGAFAKLWRCKKLAKTDEKRKDERKGLERGKRRGLRRVEAEIDRGEQRRLLEGLGKEGNSLLLLAVLSSQFHVNKTARALLFFSSSIIFIDVIR